MAFADVILSETDANIIIIDKLHKPGGHWNFAYPFVRLHQPSEYYGVSSMELSKGRKDTVGLNKGLSNLASGVEVCAYFDDVMQHRFLASGRVMYYPMCEYKGNGNFNSVITGKRYSVKVKKKTVDANFIKTSVPSVHTPNFTIAPEVQFITVNELPQIRKKAEGYVVIGGGKTGIDACLWLLEQDVSPEDIRWIVPRDAWLLDRRTLQPAGEFTEYFLKDRAAQFEALVQAQSIPDLFKRLETAGCLLRLDKTIEPKMYRCATVSLPELEQLKRIQNIIRMGRVRRIEKDEIILDKGSIDTTPNHVHIDCSADGLRVSGPRSVFSDNLITLQTVRTCQPTFSASFIAHVEAAYTDEKIKNELCSVIPIPCHDVDWIRMLAALMKNNYVWSQDASLMKWLFGNRLEGGFLKTLAGSSDMDSDSLKILEGIRNNIKPAMMKLQVFMTELKQLS